MESIFLLTLVLIAFIVKPSYQLGGYLLNKFLPNTPTYVKVCLSLAWAGVLLFTLYCALILSMLA